MKWINYHHLIYFREIARQGSISKASEVLQVGQPALSAQLKKLEEYMGVKLFDRKNRKLILTEPGKVALEYAEKIGELGQELIQVIDKKSFSKRINLKVGSQDAIPKYLVTDLVNLAHKETGCYLSVLEGTPDSLLRELETHHLDVLITDHNLLGVENKNLFSKKIIKSKVSVFASKDFKSLKRTFPASISTQPVILPTGHSRLRADLEHYFHLNSIAVDRIAETQDSMLQMILAAKGEGLVFLPELAAKEFVKEKKLFKIGVLENIFIEYFLIYPKKIIGNEALELLLKQDFKF